MVAPVHATAGAPPPGPLLRRRREPSPSCCRPRALLAVVPPADRPGPAGPRRRGRVARTDRLAGAHRGRGHRDALGLPVLRGRLRAEDSTSRTARVTQIEGDPDSPISRGRLCPKGSSTPVAGHLADRGSTKVRYRRPHGTEWEDLDLDTAMDMIADRVLDTRGAHLAGHRRPRAGTCAAPWASRSLGGATLDNEENYLIKKLYTALGADPDREPGPYLTQLHRPRSGDQLRSRRRHDLPAGPAQLRLHRHPGLEHGRGHPVGFQWVMEAKAPRRHGHPRRPAVHPHQRGGRPARADPGRHRHRVPRRPDPPRAGERARTSEEYVRRLHQRRR